MAKISVARALTKQKTLLAKISSTICKLGSNCYCTSKDLNPLSSEKDIRKNHERAKVEVDALRDSIDDSISYYIRLNAAITKSNLETTIVTSELGEISVADAIVIYQKLKRVYEDYAQAVTCAISSAQHKADKANRDLKNSNISAGITPELYATLEAQPLVLLDTKTIDNIVNRRDFIVSELNLLINESNATTIIEIDD